MTKKNSDTPIALIERAACTYFKVSREELIGPSRKHPIVQYRQVAMAVGVAMGHSTLKIGNWFGGRDHSTVMHAQKAVDEEPDLARWRDIIVGALSKDWVADVPFKTRRKA